LTTASGRRRDLNKEGRVVALDHHNLVAVTSVKICAEARVMQAYLFMNLWHSLQPK
jgi:hypothetical protein